MAEVNTRAQERLFVLFRSSFESIACCEFRTFVTVDLNRVMTINSEDYQSVRVGTEIGFCRQVLGKEAIEVETERKAAPAPWFNRMPIAR